VSALCVDDALSHERVKASRRLHRRTARVVKVSSAHVSLPFSIPFGGVEKRGKTRPVELIANFGDAYVRGLLDFSDEGGDPGDKTQFEFVNVKTFMVEHFGHCSMLFQ
jgi:hypothetical protein